MPSENQHSQVTLPKKHGGQEARSAIGQVRAKGDGHHQPLDDGEAACLPSPTPIAFVAQCMPKAGSGAVAGNDRSTLAMLRMPQPIDTRLAPRPAYNTKIEHDDLSSLSVELR